MRKKRVFIIKLPPLAREDMDKFMERLSSAIAGDTVLMKYKDGYLRVEVYGGEVLARRTKEGIKRVLDEFHAKQSGRGSRVAKKAIDREAGVAIPLDVLELVVRLSGYDVDVRDDEIIIRGPPSIVLSTARIIGEYIRESENLYATRTAKKLVVAIGALTRESIVEIVEAGLNEGILEEDDEGKLHVTCQWREAVKKLVKHLETEGQER